MSLPKASVLSFNNRSISYRRLGTGKRKILFFHGFPGSSAQILPFTNLVSRFDLEILCLDRPGYNQTSWIKTDAFTQANEDAFHLVQHFQWKQFELISVSGGTPYLFSFVKEFPQLVTKMAIVSGLGPLAQSDFSKVLSFKSLLSLRFLPYTPEAFFKIFLKQKKLLRVFLTPSESDLKVLNVLENVKVLETALHEGFLQNGVGPKQDALAYLSAWSVPVDKLPREVQIWHGAEDQIIPVGMAKNFANIIPQAQLNILPGEGHYSPAFNYIPVILGEKISS